MCYGIQFEEQLRNPNTAWSRQMLFDTICQANDIEHRLTKPSQPWTNRQVERINRTVKKATDNRFHRDSHDQQTTYLNDLIAAYKSPDRLKTLGGLGLCEWIAKIWASSLDRFVVNPSHQTRELNTQTVRVIPAMGSVERKIVLLIQPEMGIFTSQQSYRRVAMRFAQLSSYFLSGSEGHHAADFDAYGRSCSRGLYDASRRCCSRLHDRF